MLPLRCSPDETVTTRSVTFGSNRFVSAKCPRWLVPNCISKSSAVRAAGMAITPALLISTSMLPSRFSANSRIEARSARSNRRTSVLPEREAAARSPRSVSRTAITTRAPARASSRVVTNPRPLLAPVTTTVRPFHEESCAAVHGVDVMDTKVGIDYIVVNAYIDPGCTSSSR